MDFNGYFYLDSVPVIAMPSIKNVFCFEVSAYWYSILLSLSQAQSYNYFLSFVMHTILAPLHMHYMFPLIFLTVSY